MKLHDILNEMPQMVRQDVFPFAESSERNLRNFPKYQSQAKKEAQHGEYQIVSLDHDDLYLLHGNTAIGLMNLTPSRLKGLNVPTFQVMNVYITPEYQNKRLGLLLYNHVLRIRRHAFASGALMTPASRRVYTSFLKDPQIDVYALTRDEQQRLELHAGPEGVTTGNPETDNKAYFIMVAK